jgi:thiamine-phosphate pyrophosphorylase
MTPLPRVYPILDTARDLDPVMVAGAWIESGASILQFRHKAFWSREIYRQAREVGRLCRHASVRLVVNDRADFAALLQAALHLGQEDLAPADARNVVGRDSIVGFSTHNEAQLRAAAAEPVDYLALGPVFATGSKENPDPVVGVEGLRACRGLTERPLVAIGGITRTTAPSVWQAGADSIAVIGDLYPQEPTPARLRQRMEEWQQLARM